VEIAARHAGEFDAMGRAGLRDELGLVAHLSRGRIRIGYFDDAARGRNIGQGIMLVAYVAPS
jgi:hypothetical protein